MPVYSRKVKNKRLPDGSPSHREGTVYDVSFTYISNGEKLQYGKRGFLDKQSATKHEAEMRLKVTSPTYSKNADMQGKQTLGTYLLQWLDSYAKANVRPSTYDGYETNIKKHIIPQLGSVALNKVSGPMLDELYSNLLQSGLSANSVKYVQRTLGISLRHALIYQYISVNPAQHTISKISTKTKTPDPYTIQQVKKLTRNLPDSPWEFIVVMGALYGLRRNEILGLQVQNIHLEEGYFSIEHQLANRATRKATGQIITKVKEDCSVRDLPITDYTKIFFQRQLMRRGTVLLRKDCPYPDFLVLSPLGTPYCEEHISMNFREITDRLNLPKIRFHDLRHTAATNMYQLTGDFYTVGEILGHSLKGIGNQLNLSGSFEAVTDRYIDVRLERKKFVLDAYHKAIAKESPDRERNPAHRGPER